MDDDLDGGSVNQLVTLFGGWIWSTLGVETLFIVSAVFGLCNSAYAATIKVPKNAVVSHRTNQRPIELFS